jgi:tetratricopeptide (TPR) repeat protein
MPESIPLGPFLLREFLDRGAMGEVWRGEHGQEGTPVAVKVITGARARDAEYISGFRDEVRAVAGLDHPGIILLFDYGELSMQAQALSGGRLQAGSPYLVMELCSQGALDQVPHPMPWAQARRVLLRLLDALAHAHARGVIHRDLKPANILMGSDVPSRPGLKLTDFGLAHALQQERAGSTEAIMGTPFYMAPEQFEGRWRDYGPWTDLYALGCVAFELVQGHPPFRGESFWQTAMLHLRGERPALDPRLPAPEALGGWLARLMATHPRERFACAADAAWALERLSAPFEVSVDLHTTGAHTGALATLTRAPLANTHPTGGATLVDPPSPEELGLAATLAPGAEPAPHAEGEPAPGAPGRAAPDDAPPLPITWRAQERREARLQLLGAGLGLYGLRTPPMVGRQEERTALWDALHEVHDRGAARAVALQGPAGCGKSRLAAWVSQRAAEVGGALVLRAEHSARGDHTQSLARMLSGALDCLGLTRAELAARLERLLRDEGITDPYEWTALTALLAPPGEPAHDGVQFDSPGARYVLIARSLERLARRRPVILWLEDVHHGADALAFADYLCDRQLHRPSPLLLLMTARDEGLATRPQEAELLEALLARPCATRIALGPLPEADHAALVEALLGLDGDLTRAIAARTAGNPLFAVHLIGEQVQRGLLLPGPRGFVLRPGVRLELPDTLHEVWASRLDMLLAALPPGAEDALELAAALGESFSEEDWLLACAEAGVERSPLLRRALLAQGMATLTRGQWALAQSILRESLERRSRERGRWPDRHAACARMIARRHPSPERGLALTLGQHLLLAGQPDAALPHLERAVEGWTQTGEHRSAAAALALLEEALRALGAREDDPRLGRAWVLRAQSEIHLGRLHEAIACAERARDAAHDHGWPDVLPDALLRLAHARRVQGDNGDAAALYQKAISLYGQRHDLRGQANCLRALAWLRGPGATPEKRQERLQRALELFTQVGDALAAADCLRGLGQMAFVARDLPRAQALAEEALAVFARLGNHLGVGMCLNALAEVARKRGDLDAAAATYREVLTRYEAVGSANVIFPRLNLGLVQLSSARWADARRSFEEALALLTRSGRRTFQGGVHANLLPCAAAERDWAAWDHHMAQARALLAETGMHDADIAWPAQLAGDLATAADQPERARDAWTLALQQWRALRDDDRAASLAALLDQPPPPGVPTPGTSPTS